MNKRLYDFSGPRWAVAYVLPPLAGITFKDYGRAPFKAVGPEVLAGPRERGD